MFGKYINPFVQSSDGQENDNPTHFPHSGGID